MKKIKLVTILAISLFLLGACNNAEELTDHVYISFSGMNGHGEADYGIDFDSLYSKLAEEDNVEAEEEIMHSDGDAIKVKIDKEEGLSNDDVINLTIDVDNDDIKSFVGGEKEYTVEGLEDPIEVTTKEVEKGIVVNFLGASGQGTSQIDSTLSSPLNNIDFSIENDGKLENGDKAKITLDKEAENLLQQEGYVLEEGFNPTVEVKGLDIVAGKAEDIKNLDDIKRMVDEEAKRKYKNSDQAFNYRFYEIKKQNLMYRQFEDLDSDEDSSGYYENDNSHKNGTLIGIYSVSEYSDKEKKELDSEYTAIIGFNNIILDEDNKTNVAKMEEFDDMYDDTYSLESIIQLYEGKGYTKLKDK